MKSTAATTEYLCSQSDIAAYLDCELDATAELHLEAHLAGCEDCFNSLAEQKLVLRALDAAMDGEVEILLPKNFARKITVRAESGLRGLRNREERVMAATLCFMLFGLFGALALAGETAKLTGFFIEVFRVISTVAGVVAVIFYDLGLGVVVITRTLTRYMLSDSNLSALGALMLPTLLLILLAKFYLRFRDFKLW
jgi:predicted anti-sigma-YlaC factor YlaD